MFLQKVITADGSVTIKRTDLNETYHSMHGAVQESMHVFIREGLLYVRKPELKICEIGLGTGLNVLLTYQYSVNFQRIKYTALEPSPLESKWIDESGYSSLYPGAKEVLQTVYTCKPGSFFSLNSNMQFCKFINRLQDNVITQEADLIYFDAFAPRVQPEMWNEAAVDHLTKIALPGCILVTYCAQGQFRRNLQNVGWKVDRLKGPPGKRQMIRAQWKG